MSGDDLARILDELGQRLGPTGEYVFGLAVRQVYIDSSIGIAEAVIGLALLIAITVVGIRLGRQRWNAEKAQYAEGKGRWSSIQSGPDLDDHVWPFIFGAIPGGFIAACCLLLLTDSLSKLLNPEYAAIRDLLGHIGK